MLRHVEDLGVLGSKSPWKGSKRTFQQWCIKYGAGKTPLHPDDGYHVGVKIRLVFRGGRLVSRLGSFLGEEIRLITLHCSYVNSPKPVF